MEKGMRKRRMGHGGFRNAAERISQDARARIIRHAATAEIVDGICGKNEGTCGAPVGKYHLMGGHRLSRRFVSPIAR
jgi:hypothetical protein